MNKKKFYNNLMKKMIGLCLCMLLCMGIFTGCGIRGGQESVTIQQTSEPIKIATLNGPTGIGMVKLMESSGNYLIDIYQSPTDITAKVISGEVDLAALPSNLAAVLYNKTQGQVVALSPITLGVLYILENGQEVKGVADLKGKTILASGQGGTPEYVLKKILTENGLAMGEDVKVEWLANHGEVNTRLLTEHGAIAMIPEPFVSIALAKGGETVNKALDLNQVWSKIVGEELPMGVLVCQKSFVEERNADLEIFLEDYQRSVDFVNGNPKAAGKMIAQYGFIEDPSVAEAAIPNCNIVLFWGESSQEGSSMLETFYETLFQLEPNSVGGKLPG